MPEENNIIIYQLEDGKTKIDVKLEDETVWLSQQQMADLYDTTKQNISLHIKNIFDEEELDINSTVKEFLTVQKEGISSINGSTLFALTEDDEVTLVITTDQDTDLIFDGTINAKLSVIKQD